jgi:hypothetical protein
MVLMIAGRYFVTPHAVAQFRERIAPGLDYEHALGAIIRELRDHGGTPKPATSRPDAVVIRTRGGRYLFRAVVVADADGRCDAVVRLCT